MCWLIQKIKIKHKKAYVFGENRYDSLTLQWRNDTIIKLVFNI